MCVEILVPSFRACLAVRLLVVPSFVAAPCSDVLTESVPEPLFMPPKSIIPVPTAVPLLPMCTLLSSDNESEPKNAALSIPSLSSALLSTSLSTPPCTINIPLRAPSSTDIPKFLCMSCTPRSESLVDIIPFGTSKSLLSSYPALLKASNAADPPHLLSVEQILGVMTVDSVSVPLKDTSVPALPHLDPSTKLT
jgi:hypothetical protein